MAQDALHDRRRRAPHHEKARRRVPQVVEANGPDVGPASAIASKLVRGAAALLPASLRDLGVTARTTPKAK